MMKKQKLSFTVGTPAYESGYALVKAVKSIFASKGVSKFRLIVCVDGNPLDSKIEKQLKDLGADVVISPKRGGQVARINQMIGLTNTDLLILTQDDIKYEPDTIAKIVKAFEDNPKVTMVSARLFPFPAKTFLESAIEVGVRLTHKIGDNWRNGDNYLLSSGRCLGFRTEFLKKFEIPEEVINSDAYLYFENKRIGGKFLALTDAVVYNKSPQTLDEQLKQSRKFQYSLEELTRYIDIDLSKEYKVPKAVSIRAYLSELIEHPLAAIAYFAMFLYTRTQQKNMYAKAKRFWKTDKSTKG
ncbi:glycosyltransferase family 2 protein [Patescibacteria group bacterium]|nr:glycosyltransferase family 2 protein [Patescibacteria group bacterium]